MPLAVAAIRFLNPAPLMWDFEHEPHASELATRYNLRYMQPSRCAQELLAGSADLGLIPVAALTADLAVVPGCVIASQHQVRSILLLVKNPARVSQGEALKRVRMVAADTASRSSVAYAHILFDHFHDTKPTFVAQPADPSAMLQANDAALLIGDPALLAREHREQIESASPEPLLWLDVATLWRELTGLPWVAAVWAVRPDSLTNPGVTPAQLITDLQTSRDHGLAHIDDLVTEWTHRLTLSPETIRTYLTRNIHYTLDPDCITAIHRFRKLAAGIGALPALPHLNLLG